MSGRRKRLEPFETEIRSMGPKGVGIGVATDGRAVHVRRGIIGQRVKVRPAGRKKGIWKGVRTHLVRPAPDHIQPPCIHFGLCGGCLFQEVPLERQRAEKLQAAKDAVGPAPWLGIDGTDAAYGYRNKMEFSFGTARYLSQEDHDAGMAIDGRYLGLHATGRFDRVIDIPHCHLVDDAMQAALLAVRGSVLIDGAPAPWNPRSHVGFFRHLQLRRGADGVFLSLFTTTPNAEQDAFVKKAISTWMGLPEIVGLHWYLNDGVADVARGTLYQKEGAENLVMQLGRHRYALDPMAFFQVNTAGAELLYDRIGDAVGTGHRLLLDLYCGTGSIGIHLADHAESVVGIEVVPEAIENARRNAAANGVEATYRVAKVEDALDAIQGGTGVAAVVDPPRVGLHPKVAKVLADAPLDVLVYVACNPASLGRDREILEAGGWALEQCFAIDLFPQTPHLEVVGRFVRR